jgi:hypothetical protein
MRLRARIAATLAAAALLATLVPGASALPNFRDVRRAANINDGLDLCGTGIAGVNLTGGARAAGDTWISVYDTTPADNTVQNLFGDVTITADVMTKRFNNAKGGGVLALFNEGTGKKGLAAVISNAGNTDRLLLGTVSAGSKAFTPLASASLRGRVAQCAWYQVTMGVDVQGSNVVVTATVFSHATKANPNSAPQALLGWLVWSGPLPAGVDPVGQIGIAGRAKMAVEDTSIANWGFSLPV